MVAKARAGPVQNQELLLLGLPHVFRGPNIWSIFCFFPGTLVGSWVRNGAAKSQTSTYLGMPVPWEVVLTTMPQSWLWSCFLFEASYIYQSHRLLPSKKKSTWTLISLSCVIHVHFLSVPPSEHDLGFISRVPSAHLSEERCWLSKSISCLCSFPVQADLCTAARMIWKNVSLFIALLCLLIFNKMETIRPCLIWSATFYLHSHSLLLLYKLYLQLFLQHGCFFSA